jgi:hypothetical protein
MKKWTIQLTLLIALAISVFAVTRYIANYSSRGIARKEMQKNTLNRIQSAVDLRGIGRNLLDFHK